MPISLVSVLDEDGTATLEKSVIQPGNCTLGHLPQRKENLYLHKKKKQPTNVHSSFIKSPKLETAQMFFNR